ncbi:flavodoxin family protein [Methanobacterium paludis]|uniref:NADPH-dependent FMN reductase n=1 Tax=Methanobacterium paludis (strain DSM 25820 / JCM 18151 / SWAN1) TaxID=868131 RepID=F6D4I6_METPW|nr:flavodoxin family protein [Methanobacterium paludis]AEG19226.1 NADPH-dependent FMN reductase [Methanobacterium paludis]
MKKVLLLCASPRPNGNTYQVLEECADVITDEGLETEIISFAGKEFKSCVACKKCDELNECSINDGLNDIINKIRESEGFIVGTPVYFGTARGDMMSALQRIGMVSGSNDNFLSGKIGGPIAVARRGGHTSTIQEMLMFFFINDMIVPGSNSWNMVFGWAPGEVQDDKEGMKAIRKFGFNVATLIKKLS